MNGVFLSVVSSRPEGAGAAMPSSSLKVLNVAEKPSVAKEITRLLGGDRARRVGLRKGCQSRCEAFPLPPCAGASKARALWYVHFLEASAMRI